MNIKSSNQHTGSNNADNPNGTDKKNSMFKPEDKTISESINLDTTIDDNKEIKEKVLNSENLNVEVNDSKKNTEDEDKQQFIQYRNWHLPQMNDFCRKISQPQFKIPLDNLKDYKTIPKCIMHQSRKIFNCKPECIDSIWSDYKIDESCKIYDLENVNTDDSYVECINQNFGFLKPTVLTEELIEKKTELVKDLDKLCDDSTLYNSTKCKAYQLRDKCRNDSTCLEKDFNYNRKSDCTNKDYDKQVEEFQKILGIEIGNQNEMTNGNSIRKLLSIENEPFSNNKYEEDIAVSNNIISKNEMGVISTAGIVAIFLYGICSRKNMNNSKFKTCMISAVLLCVSLILVSLTI